MHKVHSVWLYKDRSYWSSVNKYFCRWLLTWPKH